MRLTSEEFNELQRWIKVRDYCRSALYNLRIAVDYANSHNYDVNEYKQTYDFIEELENKAISKLREVIK